MDLVAVALLLAVFASLWVLIELLDRVWAPRTCSGWSSPWPSCSTCSTRCCARSAS